MSVCVTAPCVEDDAAAAGVVGMESTVRCTRAGGGRGGANLGSAATWEGDL